METKIHWDGAFWAIAIELVIGIAISALGIVVYPTALEAIATACAGVNGLALVGAFVIALGLSLPLVVIGQADLLFKAVAGSMGVSMALSGLQILMWLFPE